LAILEAMAAGVPVLVPSSGGAGALVDEGISGFHFQADDAASLGNRLIELMNSPAAQLNQVVRGGDQALRTRFAPSARSADYQHLIEEQFL
jgi:glycosyltransferase involved in cell wall biosynthesis